MASLSKISVIIPVYNVEKYLKRCLDSVINQSYKNLEIICINDKSTDKSPEILKEFSQKDKRVKIINNKENVGSAVSRNLGLDATSGDYISFIDSDDYADEKYLESMFNKAQEVNCDIVLNLSVYREKDNVSKLYKYPQMRDVTEQGEFIDNISVIHNEPCFIWARLYKKSFIDKHSFRFFVSRIPTDDVAFNTVTTLFADKTFAFYGDKYHYTIRHTGITGVSNASETWDLDHMKAYNFVYDYLKNRNTSEPNLKLFRCFPFFKVDTQEKFEFYKYFFEKIKISYNANKDIYNKVEQYFADSILESDNYNDYLLKNNKNVIIEFMKQGK